jgi:hypothetical protein
LKHTRYAVYDEGACIQLYTAVEGRWGVPQVLTSTSRQGDVVHLLQPLQGK